ncbi:Hsp20/alpha crystallin family protein [Brevibacillus sp. B_LB10_24]|uniref:Hsp20/alpha crystallin family protein n=1 Tax=Brevibacillus sp. B_LB10_24 TaxID=3380645 RepID=UPI0038BB97D1
MNDLSETMKHLQRITESLSQLNSTDQSPWKTISQMQSLFDEKFWQNIMGLASFSGNADQAKAVQDQFKNFVTPKADVFQTNEKIIVCCEIPGLDLESLDISISDSRFLTVRGRIKKRRHPGLSVERERSYGNFSRQIELPSPASTKGMKRLYKDGLLELHLFKRSAAPDW